MSVMKRQLLKVKQIADQTFLKGDKSEVLNKELEATEKRLEALKQTCHVLYKKMLACHQGAGQEPLEKRKKRMPEIQLSNSMQECLDTSLDGNILLWQVLENSGILQSCLGEALLEGQLQAEKEVLAPLHDLLEVDIPNVLKLRKNLFKLSQDMDNARTRYESSVRHASQTSGPAGSSAISKADSFKEELEELTMKVEQARDTFAAELYALVSREPSVCQLLVQWYNLQAAYHQRALSILQSGTPALCKLIEDSHHRPLYGHPIEDHLRSSGREIALVLEACVCCLLDTASQEEGLFRIAGSASKVKKLKNALDAGVTDMCEYVLDPHSVAGALKSYLRDLPEPLMTFAAYDDWIQADKVPESDARLQRLWQVLNGLPKANYNNLRYLVKFLHCLCKNSEVTKMSSQNLSIVMSPNLLWSPASQQSSHMGMNMSAANAHNSIVETLISYCDWFFPDDVEFRLTLPPLASPKTTVMTPPVIEHDGGSSPNMLRGIINSGFEGVNGEVAVEDTTGHSPRVIHRPGKKPAPPVPPALSAQVLADDSRPTLRSSPPSQTGCLDRPMSRSATLDRPGKPKRASTRKSHDNLANILLLEGSKESSQSNFVPQDIGPQATIGNKDFNAQSTQPNVKQEVLNMPTGGAPLTQARNEKMSQSTGVISDRKDIPASSTFSQTTTKNDTSSFASTKVPQPMPRKEKIAVSEFVNYTNDKLETEQGRQKSPLIATKSLETGDNSSLSWFTTEKTPTNVKELEPLESKIGDKIGAVQANQLPGVKEQNNAEVPAQTSPLPNHTKKEPSSPPVYANISNQLQKNLPEKKLEVTVPKKEIGTHYRRASSEGPVGRATEFFSEKDTKPRVPSKPAALTAEARIGADVGSTNSLQTEVRSEKIHTPLTGDETDARTGTNCTGDRWHFLTSGSATAEKVPERPPKVAPVDGGAEDPNKKPPPSPSTKVKPPRPQPPAPPAKPKMNNDNEETRL